MRRATKMVTILAVLIGALGIAILSALAASHSTAAATAAAPTSICNNQRLCSLVTPLLCKNPGTCPTRAGSDAGAVSAGAASVPASATSARFTCIGPPQVVCEVIYIATGPICRKYGCGREAAPALPAAPSTPTSAAVRNTLIRLCTVQTRPVPNPFCPMPAPGR